ncbi:MAG: glycosyltransferase [Holophagales bacterium]|nr:glycosyltransferase [Holophagales bacterium]MYG31426.1 glycosyltransferase [Holophagales bacterium]MYI81359.1 glycosyltransferase [Holophagales bacterium]
MAARPNAPAVDFVSPLPPVRSGIADYSVDLLQELAPLCDLRLIRLPGQEVASEVMDRYRVVDAAASDPGGRLPFYQMGNNVYHEGVRRLALDSPGVVTVHDLRLHHLLVESTLASGDLDSYVSGLGEEHGWEGAAAALSIRWGGHGRARLFEMPAHRSLLLRQRGLLTHSNWGLRFLEEELGEWAEGRLPPMRRVPMPMPAPDLPDAEQAAAFREGAGVPRSAVLIGSFGFQTPIKRTDVLLRILAEPGMEQVHALVVGDVAPELDLGALARELGVQDRVTMTGFLDPAAFPTAISACDLCLNLRYPSAGETSASLLRILALGRAAVVSDYAQFVELPDDIVIKAPLKDDPGAEAGALAGLLRGLFTAPDRLAGMGAAARAFIEREHRPASAARVVFEALDEWSRLPVGKPPALRPPRPPAPTSLTWGWLPGRIDVEGCDPPWPGGERRSIELVVSNTGFATWLSGRNQDGGVVLEPQLWSGGRDLFRGRPWIPLPRDLPPGDACRIPLKLRRPIGRARLRCEPHLFGGGSMTLCGATAFDSEL